jgi:hypothetical protein
MTTKLTMFVLAAVALVAVTAAPAQAQYRYYNHHLHLDGYGDYVEIPPHHHRPLQ